MDKSFVNKYRIPLFIVVVFSIVSLTVFYNLLKNENRLKIYNPVDVNPSMVDSGIKHITKNHTIADFRLVNQNGEIITNKNYKDKIYISDFFFTRCQSICIPMAYNMAELQEYYKTDDDIKFLSHSVTPKMDSVSVLKAYAEKKGVNDGKWNVTSGSKKHIYELARKSYMVVQESGDGGENDFIHKENFVLVDKEGRIRGYYDGTDRKAMEKLKADVAILKEEYED